MSKVEGSVFKMDELSFLNKLYQNPAEIDDEMVSFLKENPNQLEAVKQAKNFDKELLGTLSVSPPDGLNNRIFVKNKFTTMSANDSSWFGNLSMVAASFLLVLIGMWAWQSNIGNSFLKTDAVEVASLDKNVSMMTYKMIDHILEHVVEATDLVISHELAVNDAELQKAFKFVGASLNKPLNSMTYAGACIVDGKQGLHVVIQEKTGPVTVIVMPGEVLTAIQSFKKAGYTGNLIPVKGAVVAIIGKTSLDVAMAQMHFFKAIEFS